MSERLHCRILLAIMALNIRFDFGEEVQRWKFYVEVWHKDKLIHEHTCINSKEDIFFQVNKSPIIAILRQYDPEQTGVCTLLRCLLGAEEFESSSSYGYNLYWSGYGNLHISDYLNENTHQIELINQNIDKAFENITTVDFNEIEGNVARWLTFRPQIWDTERQQRLDYKTYLSHNSDFSDDVLVNFLNIASHTSYVARGIYEEESAKDVCLLIHTLSIYPRSCGYRQDYKRTKITEDFDDSRMNLGNDCEDTQHFMTGCFKAILKSQDMRLRQLRATAEKYDFFSCLLSIGTQYNSGHCCGLLVDKKNNSKAYVVEGTNSPSINPYLKKQSIRKELLKTISSITKSYHRQTQMEIPVQQRAPEDAFQFYGNLFSVFNVMNGNHFLVLDKDKNHFGVSFLTVMKSGFTHVKFHQVLYQSQTSKLSTMMKIQLPQVEIESKVQSHLLSDVYYSRVDVLPKIVSTVQLDNLPYCSYSLLPIPDFVRNDPYPMTKEGIILVIVADCIPVILAPITIPTPDIVIVTTQLLSVADRHGVFQMKKADNKHLLHVASRAVAHYVTFQSNQWKHNPHRAEELYEAISDFDSTLESHPDYKPYKNYIQKVKVHVGTRLDELAHKLKQGMDIYAELAPKTKVKELVAEIAHDHVYKPEENNDHEEKEDKSHEEVNHAEKEDKSHEEVKHAEQVSNEEHDKDKDNEPSNEENETEYTQSELAQSDEEDKSDAESDESIYSD